MTASAWDVDASATGLTMPIVVGVAPGWHSTSAVMWAGQEASRGGHPLELVTATHDAGEEAAARSTLAGLASRLILDAPSLRVQVGAPVEVLLCAAIGASELVVGRRDPGSVPLPSVSTSRALAGAASAPVVVVPEAWIRPGLASAPVVVGLEPDPSARTGIADDPDRRLLDFAFARAARGRVPLIVVAASSPGAAHSLSALEARLAPWAARWPRIEVAPRVVDEPPARALLDAGAAGQLIVVGRGSVQEHGSLWGSTTQEVLQRAGRPVAVVPAAPLAPPDRPAIVRTTSSTPRPTPQPEETS